MVRRSDPVPNDSKPLKGFVTPAKTAARADFLVADAVPPNRSPRVEFPANRENSREFLPFFDDFRENGR